jgi:hypothetical protein
MVSDDKGATATAVVLVKVKPLPLALDSLDPNVVVQGCGDFVLHLHGGPFDAKAKVAFGNRRASNPTISTNDIYVTVPGSYVDDPYVPLVSVTDGVYLTNSVPFTLLRAPHPKMTATASRISGDIVVEATILNTGDVSGDFSFDSATLKATTTGSVAVPASAGVPSSATIGSKSTTVIHVTFPGATLRVGGKGTFDLVITVGGTTSHNIFHVGA